MTKKLESLFDLPIPGNEDEKETEITEEESEIISVGAMTNLEKIDAALPMIRDLAASDQELDDIAKKAMQSYQDLIDLGMNVEARIAKDILLSASNFLGHAITAKNTKINKKLKMIEMQLKKAKLDLDTKKALINNDENDGIVPGKMLDRNEIIAEILKAKKEEDNDQ